MKRAALLALLFAACVPSAEEKEPRGAAGFRTEPSAGSRGESFTTTDGWSLRVETFVLHLGVYANAIDPNLQSGGYGEGFIFHGRNPTEVFAPALLPGSYRVNANLAVPYVYKGKVSRNYEFFDIDEALEQRMMTAAPVPRDRYGGEYAPSVILVVRGESAGRAVTLDVAVPALNAYRGSTTGPTVRVAANVAALLRLEVRVESTFERQGKTTFGEIAGADANGDGRVNETELSGVPDACPECTSGVGGRGQEVEHSLLDTLSARLPSILVPK